MEKIEQVLDLPKFNAVIVAHYKENPSFLNFLLSEDELAEEISGFGWYLYLEHLNSNKKASAAYIELDLEEIGFLQSLLKKALFKLAILEKVTINGFYVLNYDGIKNLKLEIKSQDSNCWLELILASKSRKKYVTKLVAEDVRAIVQKLQTVEATGNIMVKQLETIEALTENLEKQSVMPQRATPVAAPSVSSTSSSSPSSQPIDGTKLVRHLETLAHNKTKKIH